MSSVSRGNFAEKTVAFQKCPGFDTDELIKAGIKVLRFEAEPRLGGEGSELLERLELLERFEPTSASGPRTLIKLPV